MVEAARLTGTVNSHQLMVHSEQSIAAVHTPLTQSAWGHAT